MIRPLPGAARRAVAALVLAALAVLPYEAGGGLEAFVDLDDGVTVFENRLVLGGLSANGVRTAFTSITQASWIPLTLVSHMADVSLFGLDARGHHLHGVLLHALGTAALFLALVRLTGAPGRSAFVAALFAVHPLHVESVAWVAARKDVLSGLFFSLTLLAYAGYVRRPDAPRYLAVALSLACGLLSKPMLVTVPFLLLLLDWWPLGRLRGGGPASVRRLVLEKLPLFAMAAACGAVTIVAQRLAGAVQTLEHFPPGARAVNAAVSAAGYLAKTAWPAHLAVYYPHPGRHPWGVALASAALLLAVSLFALRLRRRHPWLGAGWLWYLGMLVPVAGLVQIGGQAMADRYTYLPLTGVFALGVWEAAARTARDRRGRAAALAAGCCALALLAWRAAGQAAHWRDSERLFTHALSVTAGNWMIHGNLGFVLERQGRVEEAVGHYRESLRLRPENHHAHDGLAIALFRLGERGEAEGHAREALRLAPGYAPAHNTLGMLREAAGDRAAAAASYREALRLQPDFAEAHYNLANVLAAAGDREAAVDSYREALRLKPDFLEARHNLANLLEDLGRGGEAAAHRRAAGRLRPAPPPAP